MLNETNPAKTLEYNITLLLRFLMLWVISQGFRGPLDVLSPQDIPDEVTKIVFNYFTFTLINKLILKLFLLAPLKKLLHIYLILIMYRK